MTIKKAHEVDSLSETFLCSNPLYPNYHPTIKPYSIGVFNPLFDQRIISTKYQNHILGICQGILFHKSNIFIFSPFLQNDIVSNLMTVIYQEYNCHTLIVQLTSETEKKKKLEKAILTIAYKVMKMTSFEALNCSEFLNKTVFERQVYTHFYIQHTSGKIQNYQCDGISWNACAENESARKKLCLDKGNDTTLISYHSWWSFFNLFWKVGKLLKKSRGQWREVQWSSHIHKSYIFEGLNSIKKSE